MEHTKNLMKCQVVKCSEDAVYISEFDTFRMPLINVFLCEEHYLYSLCFSNDKQKQQILKNAKLIKGEIL